MCKLMVIMLKLKLRIYKKNNIIVIKIGILWFGSNTVNVKLLGTVLV